VEPPRVSDAPAVLTMAGVGVRFGTVRALDDARLRVRPGTVHAVLGENGAGKTTLMRVAFGLVAPDAGTMTWRGAPYAPRSPLDAIAVGMGMVFQHFSLVPAMTVAENVALGGRGRFDAGAAAREVQRLGERTGLVLDPALRIADAPVGAQQRCEILKALARTAGAAGGAAGAGSLLVLDEPTAVLAPSEARELLAWVRRHADGGQAVVLITHKLRDALAVADDVTVLRRGRTVLESPAAALDEGALAAAMLGDGADGAQPARSGDVAPHPAAAQGPVVLRLADVHARDGRGVERLRGVSLEVRSGEIVGVAAIEGAGQRELLRVLAGRLVPSAGRCEAPAAVGFVPEDRHHDAVLLDGTLVENRALRDAGARRGRMPWGALRAESARLVAASDVRASGVDAAMRSLSGGNQQKFVLARELADAPAALVVENPTRGLDIRAAAAVHAALRQARADGTALVIYSTDLDEVLALADRVVVMHAGELTPVAADRELVGRAMLSGAAT
jgi:simple sugar transport system ATP-binding protein